MEELPLQISTHFRMLMVSHLLGYDDTSRTIAPIATFFALGAVTDLLSILLKVPH